MYPCVGLVLKSSAFMVSIRTFLGKHVTSCLLLQAISALRTEVHLSANINLIIKYIT